MKNPLQNIDSSTTFFFAVLVFFVGLRSLPPGAHSVEQNEFNSEMFMSVTLDSVPTCQDKKDPKTSNISYLP